VLLILFASAFEDVVWGQAGSSFRGTVTDPSGGVVAGAKVTFTNQATGISKTATTNTEGAYLFDPVTAGTYKIAVEKSGFASFIQSGIVLALNQNGHLDVGLKVGQASEVIEVTGIVSQVDMTNAVLGKVENEHAIKDLPLADRDTLQLGLLQAGVFNPDPDDTTGNPFSVSGQRSESLTFLLDGANNTDFLGNNIVVSPNPDAVQEFRILTNNYDSQYGRTSGGIVNQITKSGTNSFHGDAFYFNRNDALNARDYFAQERSPYSRNLYGGTVGGPIKKNKAFFFVGFQGTGRAEGQTPTPIGVLSQNERTGNFGELCTNPNTGGPGFDGAGNCLFTPAQNKNFTGTQLVNPITGNNYPFNVVPVNPVIANYISKYLPLPNIAGTNNFVSSPIANINDDQGIVHFDWTINPRDTISIVYLIDDERDSFPLSGGTISSTSGAQPPGNGGTVPVGSGASDSSRNQIGTFVWTHSFNGGKLNEFRFATNRLASTQAVAADNTPPTALGFTNIVPADANAPAPPTIFGPSFTLGPSVQGPATLHRATFQWADNFTWTLGRHEIRFGVDITRIRNNFDFDFYNNGGFTFFSGAFTGSPYSDFVAGFWDNFFQSSFAIYGIRTSSFAGYIQDTYKILPRLTLNYGLRYEYYTPQYDIHNEILGWFPGKQSTIFPNAPPNILYPNDPGTPNRGLVYPDYTNFAPRFGLAWDMLGSGKLVMRTGFGIFYDIEDGALNLQFGGQPPFGFAPNISPSSFDGSFSDCVGAVACGPVADPLTPFGQVQPFPFVQNGTFLVPPIPFAYVAQPNFRTPYSENFNFGFQWQATKDTMLEAVYVGSLGRRLIATAEVNFPQPSVMQHQLATYGCQIPGCALPVNFSPINPECARQYSACTGGTLNPNDPFDPTGSPTGPQQLLSNFSDGFSHSNQLQISADRTLNHGLQFRVAYTLAKTIDQQSGFRSRSSEWTDPVNHALDNGLADFDAPQRLVISALYQLPLDRGIHSNGFAKKMLGGWQFNTIATFQRGNPLTFFSNSNASQQNQFPDLNRVNVIGPVPYQNPRSLNNSGFPSQCNGGNTAPGNFWIDPSNMVCNPCPMNDPTCALPADQPGIPLLTIGNLPRNSLRGPGINNWDMSILKNTNITESKMVEFRAEFFNTFNHTQFFSVDHGQFGSDSTYGQVLTDRGPRVIQLALKFYF
jgi:hypothetical protein